MIGFSRAEKYRWRNPSLPKHSFGDPHGAFLIKRIGLEDIRIVANNEFMGWEHVSVSLSRGKTPTWSDMCFVKDLFWEAEDCVVQFHPPKSEYVNFVDNCLHLWRWVGGEFPQPSSIMVGPKGVER